MGAFRLHSAFIIAFVCAGWLAAPTQAQQLERPGAGLPNFETPPPQEAAPQGVREKTDAVMKSVGAGQPGVRASKVTTTTMTVEGVDPAKRVVTLRSEDGVRMEKPVAPDVDLTQVKVGDRVLVKAIESVAVFVARGSLAAPPAERNVVVETSEPGEKPARLTVETEEITATVASIDHPQHTVTLLNPDGSTRTVPVDPRVDLEEVQVGDQVTLRLTKALALAVEPPH